MKYFLLYTTALLVTITLLFSCRPKELISSDNGIKFDTIYSTKNYHLDNDSTKPSCNLKLSFVYPSSYQDNAALLDSLQKIFIRCFFNEAYAGLKPQNAIKIYEENYVESYKEDARIFSIEKSEHDGGDMYSSYYEIDNNLILFNRNGILSFQVNRTNYKGGASSYEFIKNYSINLKSMAFIDEDDIFIEGYENMLGTTLKDRLLWMKKAKSIEELENLGYFGLEEMLPNGNFALDQKGITYIFNKGEYSGYADQTTIFIPYTDIRPLIKEGSVVSQFISM